MATEKKITSRIQQKHDVAANWAKATNFIPKKGEIIIYDAEYNASGEETQPVRFKIGDGSKTVNNLPFAVIDYSSDIETLEQKVANNSTAIGKIQGAFETNGTTVKKATSAGTADKVANGLTLGGGVVYDGSKALSITAGDKMSITGGPGGVSIGLAYSVMPSTYNKVTVDGYGTVTAGENIDYLTSHQSIKSINTNNTAAQTVNASEAIAGSGTINLHKVAKTGSYNDLLYKPTIPAAANNGTLTIQKNGTKVQTFTANQSSSVTANITVPIKVSELTNDSGYTTNKGTVTSVAVKMNGSEKGKVTSSGTIDLGTVLTSHQDISGKLDKTTYEVNKTIDFGSSGALYVGKFKVYDTNVTCEVTSTTNVTYSGKLVIATQNYVIAQMTVYGDAANTVAPNFFVKPSTTSDPYIEVYFKPSSWSKNVVHIYGSNIQAEPTDVCTNIPAVPSTATLKPKNALDSKANLNGGNTFSGAQTFKDFIEFVDSNGDGVLSLGNNAIFVDPEGRGLIPVSFSGDFGLSGQVLTSQGGNTTPIWATPAIKSATLTGTTLYLTL